MGGALSPDELDALLGAYALDALDADERAQVDAWLARSPKARRDADELRETASLLAQSAGEPPADLWSRIELQLGDAEAVGGVPPLRMSGVVDLGARRPAATAPSRRRPWLVGIAAAAALVVAVTAGVVVGQEVADQDARIAQLAQGMEGGAMERAALAAAMEPGARSTQLTSPSGAVLAKVVATAEGRGYFMADGMPSLPRGRTYQLWALMSEEPGSDAVSVGVLGRAPAVMAFNADSSVQGFVVTEEDAPGTSRSTQPAMAEGWLV